MTERPHILPPPPGGGALRRPDETGAAFFDLDRTLMAGSSAFQFGRAAYRAGLVSRRQLAADAWENVRFRLRGSTDAGTDALRERDRRAARGRARARPAAARARRARRRAAAPVPAHARDRLRAPGRRPADLHLHRGVAGDGRADGDRAHLRRRGRLGLRGRRRPLHRPRRRPVHLPRGQGRGDPRAGRARGHRPRRLVGLLGLRVRPADAAARRPPGRGQPRRGARARRARRGLGGPALRAPRPPAARRRRRRASPPRSAALGSVVLSRRSAPPRRRGNVVPLRRR